METVQSVNDEITLPLTLERSLEKLIENEYFTTFEINKKIASTAGGSYMGDYYEVDIKGETDIGKKELNIFIKVLKGDQNEFSVVSVKEMYMREVYVYTELSNLFTNLQQEAGIPDGEMFRTVKFYNTNNPDVLIMDNITTENYKVLNRMEIVSPEYAQAAVQILAKLHALSYVIKIKKPEYYNNVIKTKNFLFALNEDYKNMVQPLHEAAMDVLTTEEAKAKLKTFSQKAMEKYNYYYLKEPASRRNVLCHGDYRVSNILYRESNGVISDLVPVDYQVLYFGNPIEDITFFIFGATDSSFREKHLHNLKDLYFKSFSSFLRRFTIEAEDVYSRVEFEKDFKDRLEFGLLMGLHLLPFILAPKGDACKEKKELGIIDMVKVSQQDNYKARINDLVNDFIKWGYL